MSDYDVIIIGGGIVGLACAAGLARRGVKKIKIYEKARSLKPIGAALSFYPNGERALGEISPEVLAKVKASCILNRREIVKDLDGNIVRDQRVKALQSITSGHQMRNFLVRYLFQTYLLEDIPNGVIELGREFKSFSVDDKTGLVKVRVLKRNSGSQREKTCRVLIGADGIRSEVRTQLFGNRLLYYHERMVFRATIDLKKLDKGSCPKAGATITYQGKEKGKLFSYREAAKGILTFTCTSVMNAPCWSNTVKERKENLQKMFTKFPSDVKHILDNVTDSAIHEDGIYSVNVAEGWSKGPVVILGDAAHAMPAGLEQGANLGLEDACELVHELSPIFQDDNLSKKSITEALADFWHKRINRVKEVHGQSDESTTKLNESKNGEVLSYYDLDEDFSKRLCGWKPSYVEDNMNYNGAMRMLMQWVNPIA